MDEKKLVTRGQFIGIIGSMAATVVLMKFVDSKKALSTVFAKKSSPALATNSYGNHTYVGKAV